MYTEKNLYLSTAALTIAVMISACDSRPQSTERADANHDQNSVIGATAPATAPDVIVLVPVSGGVSFTGFSHEDGSVMTDAELSAAIAEFPALGVNYQQLLDATQADGAADGTLTLRNSDGNILIVIVPAGYETIRSLGTTAGTQTAQSCTGTSFLLDLNDSSPEVPCQSQGQGQDKDKEKCAPKQARTAGFHVLLTMACQVTKQEKPKQEQKKP